MKSKSSLEVLLIVAILGITLWMKRDGHGSNVHYSEPAVSTTEGTFLRSTRWLDAVEGESSSMESNKDCVILEKCSLCTYSEQKSDEICKETGHREKWECTISLQDSEGMNFPTDSAFSVFVLQLLISLHFLFHNDNAYFTQLQTKLWNFAVASIHSKKRHLQWYVRPGGRNIFTFCQKSNTHCLLYFRSIVSFPIILFIVRLNGIHECPTTKTI